jgi:hypothetical protein
MSLPQVAQQLARKGRNGDTMLVHMSKDEVKGLASLAGANGMQLTTNPETGLPEAFKLGKVLQAALPIAAGFALGPAGWGLMSSGMAGLTVGGLYGLATGSVEKGLMAGLGAWGGAGLGGASAGASTAPATTGALTGPAATTVATPTAASLTTPLTSSATVAPTAFAAQPTVAGLTAAPASTLGSITPATTSTLGSITAPANALTYQAATPGIGSSIAGFAKANPFTTAALVGGPLLAGMEQDTPAAVETKKGMIRPYTFAREVNRDAFKQPMDGSTAERNYFTSQRYTPLPAYEAAEGGQVPRFEQMQPGGLASLQGMRDGYAPMTTPDGNIPQYAFGGGVSSASAVADQNMPAYSFNPETQQYTLNSAPQTASPRTGGLIDLLLRGARGEPAPKNTSDPVTGYLPYAMGTKFSGLLGKLFDGTNSPVNAVGAYRDETGNRYLPKYSYEGGKFENITPGMAGGGLSTLGGYSDGGRLLKGPGDGVSDSIPATINNKQPAKLADGEFVVPARIVSEIGNGSTDAGARKLYAMMDRVQKKRGKTVGKNKVAVNSRADKDLPA